MANPNPPVLLLFFFSFFIFSRLPFLAFSKSTIEPCSVSDSCAAFAGYTLPTDLKVAELANLFQIDPISLLTANSIDISYPDLENHILPSNIFLKIPLTCSCQNGIRKSLTSYKTRPSDTLDSIAGSVYSGLVSADQIRDASGIDGEAVLDAGQSLVVPIPCVCFNLTDNALPAVYLAYVVRAGETISGIAARFYTTVTDVMNVNSMGSMVVNGGDILAIPLPACASSFPSYSSDFGLIVPNGSYAITASHCVQCSCGPGNLNLYCTPASLAVSCSSMQCKNSNLMLGNDTSQPTSAGCNVTACSYGGFVNGSIVTTLSASLQPRCPGNHQFPPLMPPPALLTEASPITPSPSPSPSQPGGAGTTIPKSSQPRTSIFPGMPPANGPSGSTSTAPSLVKPLSLFLNVLLLSLVLELVVYLEVH